MMGSPDGEAGRKDDEGPQHEVDDRAVLDGQVRSHLGRVRDLEVQPRHPAPRADQGRSRPSGTKLADAVARPTKPYTDMTFGMGKEGYPAICMTQLAAKMYCKWLSRQDGPLLSPADRGRMGICLPGRHEDGLLLRRRPGEARRVRLVLRQQRRQVPQGRQEEAQSLGPATTCTATWPSGAWTSTCPTSTQQFAGKPTANPLVGARRRCIRRSVRGGSWDDDPEQLRSAARRGSSKDWKQQDPQIPQSIWYFTDALFVGFRVVRPLGEPSAEEKAKFGPDAVQQ